MKKILSICMAVVGLMSACDVLADNLKIGVVDMGILLQKSPMMAEMNSNLNKKFKPRQDEITTSQRRLQDEVDSLNNAGPAMSLDDRTKLQNKIVQDKASIEIINAGFQRDLTIAKSDSMQEIMSKLTNVINKVAIDGHYDLIEQRTNMLFINKQLDITDQILKQLS